MEDISSDKLALSWSGGKDSALALWALREEHGLQPRALITTVTDAYARVSMHGVRRELLAQQARRVGVELLEIEIPVGCTNSLYEQRMASALASEQLREVECVAFGDLFLQDVREYRETRMSAAGRRAVFPLWQRDTTALARRFVDSGFQAVLVCVDPRKLDASFAGRGFDAQLLRDLPAGVDPCGENGEFHTFVYDGPVFSTAVECGIGEIVERNGFVFCDLIER